MYPSWLRALGPLSFLLLASPGCHHRRSPKPTPVPSTGIRAKITLPCTVCDSRDFSVRITFTNYGETKLKLNHFVVQLPQLTLAVFGAKGQRVPQVPPPVPPPNLEQFEAFLYPDSSYEVSYPLAIPAAQMPNGTYVLRVRGFPADAVAFTLKVKP